MKPCFIFWACLYAMVSLAPSGVHAQPSDARNDILNSLRGQVTLPEPSTSTQQASRQEKAGANDAIDLANLPVSGSSGEVARIMQARERAEQAAVARAEAQRRRQREAAEAERLAQEAQQRREREERDREMEEFQAQYARERARDSARTWNSLANGTYNNSPSFVTRSALPAQTTSAARPAAPARNTPVVPSSKAPDPVASTTAPVGNARSGTSSASTQKSASARPSTSSIAQDIRSSISSASRQTPAPKSKVYEPIPEVAQGDNDNWWGDRDHAIELARLGAVNDISAQCSAKGARVDRPTDGQLKAGTAPVRWSFNVPDCKQGGWEGREWKCKVEVAGTCYRMQ